MIVDKTSSFTAANSIPIKIVDYLSKIKREGRIPPVHIQLNPINLCNLNCPFCSCDSRNRNEKLSYKDIKTIMVKAKNCGCKAVTITGGGEPLLHPKINSIINFINSLDIKIGLVTNGTQLHKLSDESINHLTWCRISHADHRPFGKGKEGETYWDYLHEQVNRSIKIITSSIKPLVYHFKVDWAFSYVLSKNPNYQVLEDVIWFANEHQFTHVRIVSDLLDLDNVPRMEEVKKELKKRKVNDYLVIYQGRKEYTKGVKECYISLLKPNIGPDGFIYPCCGCQYALETPSKDYEKKMRMCKAKDIDRLYESQKHFDGRICDRCYYDNYNQFLKTITSKIEHKEFV